MQKRAQKIADRLAERHDRSGARWDIWLAVRILSAARLLHYQR